MSDDRTIADRFWKALKSDRVMMLGVDGVEDGFARPMAVQIDDEGSPLWFFASTDNHVVAAAQEGRRAIATFVSKGYDVYASLQGSMVVSRDQAMVDKLWNPQASAWFEEGKDDPKLRLLRFDAERAEVWLDGSSVAASLKSMLGIDPKKDGKKDQATVSL